MRVQVLLASLTVLLTVPSAAAAQAQFHGLTEIDVTTSANPAPSEITITKPGGQTVPASAITVQRAGDQLRIGLKADQFARTTSAGTTISIAGSAPAAVARPGEPAANAHIV